VANFSASEAIGSGFRLIGRTPWVLLAWALAYLLLMLPQFAVLAGSGPHLFGLFQAMAKAPPGAPPDPGQMMALQQQMIGVQAVGWLTAIVVNTLLMAAVYRAVLEPQARGWAYLRLGAAELWLGLMFLVLMFLLMLMMFALIIPLAIGGGIMAAAAHGAPGASGGLVFGLAAAAGVVAIVWVFLRLSLALPLSFAERRFLLFESWALTRGHALKIFAVAIAVVVIVWVLEMVVVALLAVLLWVPLSFGGFDLSTLSTTPMPELLRRLLPALLLLIPVWALFVVAMTTVMMAPWADIYRQLTRADAPA
jgi:hypothetical protein